MTDFVLEIELSSCCVPLPNSWQCDCSSCTQEVNVYLSAQVRLLLPWPHAHVCSVRKLLCSEKPVPLQEADIYARKFPKPSCEIALDYGMTQGGLRLPSKFFKGLVMSQQVCQDHQNSHLLLSLPMLSVDRVCIVICLYAERNAQWTEEGTRVVATGGQGLT